MEQLYDNYVAVLVGAVVGVLIVGGALFANFLFAPRMPSRPKALSYECGMLPIGRNVTQVHFRYYLFGILFLIFDVETVFLYPWAVAYRQLPLFALFEMFVFLFLLIVALVYAWRKGALTWA